MNVIVGGALRYILLGHEKAYFHLAQNEVTARSITSRNLHWSKIYLHILVF